MAGAEEKISGALERELDKVERECIRPLQVKRSRTLCDEPMYLVISLRSVRRFVLHSLSLSLSGQGVSVQCSLLRGQGELSGGAAVVRADVHAADDGDRSEAEGGGGAAAGATPPAVIVYSAVLA